MKGRVTIPTDVDIIKETKKIMKLWGADAVRDCDGTDMPKEIEEGWLNYKDFRKSRGKGKAAQGCYS